MALNIDPPASTFDSVKGGLNKHTIVNTTDKRHAFKIKCSNNMFYRVSSVYGFVDPNGKKPVDVHRLPGGLRGPDRFVVQWAEVPAEESDPKAPFLAQAQSGEVVFNVTANPAGTNSAAANSAAAPPAEEKKE
uniref:Major sperm protein n=1 Tax=Meloidogyne javanica TaxID=6303 RepID=A0A915ND81_MELJA